MRSKKSWKSAMYELRQHRIKFYRSCTTIPVNKSASNGLPTSINIAVSFSRIWLVHQRIRRNMKDVWTSSTVFLSFSLKKLFHIDLYDHQTSFYNIKKTINSNFVRHRHHSSCQRRLISTLVQFYSPKEERLKNPQLVYEPCPSSKEEENITIIVILPLQAAGLQRFTLLEDLVSTYRKKFSCTS